MDFYDEAANHNPIESGAGATFNILEQHKISFDCGLEQCTNISAE